MLSTNDDSQVRPTNTVADLPPPGFLYAVLYRRIGNAERRFGISGLGNQVSTKIFIVVVVKTNEDASGVHSRVNVLPGSLDPM